MILTAPFAPEGFKGMLVSVRSAVYLADLSDGAIDAILVHQAKKMSPLSFVPIFPLGGAYRKANDDATAFGGSRDIRYVVNISATAMSPDDYEAERAWSRGTGRHWSSTLRVLGAM